MILFACKKLLYLSEGLGSPSCFILIDGNRAHSDGWFLAAGTGLCVQNVLSSHGCSGLLAGNTGLIVWLIVAPLCLWPDSPPAACRNASYGLKSENAETPVGSVRLFCIPATFSSLKTPCLVMWLLFFLPCPCPPPQTKTSRTMTRWTAAAPRPRPKELHCPGGSRWAWAHSDVPPPPPAPSLQVRAAV